MVIYADIEPALQCDFLFPDMVCYGEKAESGLMSAGTELTEWANRSRIKDMLYTAA